MDTVGQEEHSQQTPQPASVRLRMRKVTQEQEIEESQLRKVAQEQDIVATQLRKIV